MTLTAVSDVYEIVIDGAILETLAIVTLAGALAALVYYRQLMRQRDNNRGNQRPGNDNNAQAIQAPQQQPQARQGQADGLGSAGGGGGESGSAGEAERRTQEQREDDERNREREANADRGVFPAPGDPEVNNWVAGGVGH